MSTMQLIARQSFLLRPCRAQQGAFATATRTAVPSRAICKALPVQKASRRSVQVQAASSASPGPLPEVETAKEAIELGNQLGKESRWKEALDVYERALSLPGTGLKRYRDKPRLISDGERMAALFNIACCHSQLGDMRSGLVALAGCLELGYTDFDQLRGDPDLAALREDERFEGLIKRFEPKANSLFGGFSGFFGNK